MKAQYEKLKKLYRTKLAQKDQELQAMKETLFKALAQITVDSKPASSPVPSSPASSSSPSTSSVQPGGTDTRHSRSRSGKGTKR